MYFYTFQVNKALETNEELNLNHFRKVGFICLIHDVKKQNKVNCTKPIKIKLKICN